MCETPGIEVERGRDGSNLDVAPQLLLNRFELLSSRKLLDSVEIVGACLSGICSSCDVSNLGGLLPVIPEAVVDLSVTPWLLLALVS